MSLSNMCQAYKLGLAESFPKRKAKKDKPQKHGFVYWIVNDENEVCFERRNEKRMLGGMLGLPTSDWVLNDESIKKQAKSKNTGHFITHSFTHFDLKLYIYTLNAQNGIKSTQTTLFGCNTLNWERWVCRRFLRRLLN